MLVNRLDDDVFGEADLVIEVRLVRLQSDVRLTCAVIGVFAIMFNKLTSEYDG